MSFTTDDYKSMEVKELTYEDAVNDENFTKRPADVAKYCGLDDSFMRSISDFQDDELVTFIRAMGDFYVDGILPDYSSITSTAVKLSLRGNIQSHSERMRAAYVSAYQSFVKGKKRKDKDKA